MPFWIKDHSITRRLTDCKLLELIAKASRTEVSCTGDSPGVVDIGDKLVMLRVLAKHCVLALQHVGFLEVGTYSDIQEQMDT